MSPVDQLAELLFVKFQKEFPRADMNLSATTANQVKKNIEQRLNRFYKEARAERKKRHLWVIGWARALLKLQQRLSLAGYPPELISKILIAMMIYNSYKAE
jgi:hypothetical protein